MDKSKKEKQQKRRQSKRNHYGWRFDTKLLNPLIKQPTEAERKERGRDRERNERRTERNE